jgi:hypothetical protein
MLFIILKTCAASKVPSVSGNRCRNFHRDAQHKSHRISNLPYIPPACRKSSLVAGHNSFLFSRVSKLRRVGELGTVPQGGGRATLACCAHNGAELRPLEQHLGRYSPASAHISSGELPSQFHFLSSGLRSFSLRMESVGLNVRTISFHSIYRVLVCSFQRGSTRVYTCFEAAARLLALEALRLQMRIRSLLGSGGW